MTTIDQTVLIHIDAQGFLEVKQGPAAFVLFIDERTMEGKLLVVPKADEMREIEARIHMRPVIHDGSDISQDLLKPLMALRKGLTLVSERTS